jgi:RNA-directed DNA polymerase
MQRRQLPARHGAPARARGNLVVPLFHEKTAMRTTDTAGQDPGRSGAVSRLGDRAGDVDSTNGSATPVTRGTSRSTTATRTTTTATITSASASSADHHAAVPPFSALVAAYFDCRRTKRNTASALAFEHDLERNLFDLYAELRSGTYRPGRSICFVVTRPKPREVWAAEFRDRIVHHLLYNHIGPRFERAFIADSCACIRGRGTLYAAQRLEAKIRSVTQNWSRPAHYLKLDIANFFVSIDKRVLWAQLAAHIPEPWWRDLAHLVLMHDPRQDAMVQSTPQLMALVPPHKSLLNQPAHLGLPIGNLSSQFFANVYMDVLDQHVKHTLRARHYIRYVDDFVLLHADPAQLNAWHDDIAAFLPRELGIRLNEAKTILQPIERGVDFVGQVLKPWHRTTRRRTLHSALHRLQDLDVGEVYESGNSYFGLLRQATHSHHERALLANVLRGRGHSVDRKLTKVFRRTTA